MMDFCIGFFVGMAIVLVAWYLFIRAVLNKL